MKVFLVKDSKPICENVKIAQSFVERSLGLMFMDEMRGFDGLLISPCNSIHTHFMRFSLDVLFLSTENKVVKVIKNMKPWRMSWIYFSANKVLELPAGTLPEGISPGDEVEIRQEVSGDV